METEASKNRRTLLSLESSGIQLSDKIVAAIRSTGNETVGQQDIDTHDDSPSVSDPRD